MTYEDHRATLIAYLKSKVEIGDWHGASDACNDLREIEAQERGRREFRVRQPTAPNYE